MGPGGTIRLGPPGFRELFVVLLAAYLGNHLRLRVAVFCAGCRLVGSRLTSAWLWVLRFPCLALTLGYIRFKQKLLVTGVVV